MNNKKINLDGLEGYEVIAFFLEEYCLKSAYLLYFSGLPPSVLP